MITCHWITTPLPTLATRLAVFSKCRVSFFQPSPIPTKDYITIWLENSLVRVNFVATVITLNQGGETPKAGKDDLVDFQRAAVWLRARRSLNFKVWTTFCRWTIVTLETEILDFSSKRSRCRKLNTICFHMRADFTLLRFSFQWNFNFRIFNKYQFCRKKHEQ